MDRVVIEDYAIVSQCSFLLAGTHDIDDPNFQLQTKPIHIGRRAWVAACAIVGPGVTIGEGAVLGGGGVAFKDLEPWTVYAGNPARRVRARNRWETGTWIMNDAKSDLTSVSSESFDQLRRHRADIEFFDKTLTGALSHGLLVGDDSSRNCFSNPVIPSRSSLAIKPAPLS